MELNRLVITSAFIILALEMIQSDIVTLPQDPCINYEVLNNSRMMTSYLRQPLSKSLCATESKPPTWYRYVSSHNGLLATSCPSANQCISDSQIWMNDQIPQSTNTTRIRLCVATSTPTRLCCDQQQMADMKICGDFVVYHLYFVRTPDCRNYCFNSSSKMNLPTSRPTTEVTSVSVYSNRVSVSNSSSSTLIQISVPTTISGSLSRPSASINTSVPTITPIPPTIQTFGISTTQAPTGYASKPVFSETTSHITELQTKTNEASVYDEHNSTAASPVVPARDSEHHLTTITIVVVSVSVIVGSIAIISVYLYRKRQEKSNKHVQIIRMFYNRRNITR